MSEILKVENLDKSYKDGEKEITVLHDVSFALNKGDFYSIQGPSGSGKSTLLNVIGALAVPDKGRIFINGKDIDEYYRQGTIHEYRLKHIGFIFQNHLLMPDFTLLENVMMPLMIAKTPGKEARQRAADILDKVGLSDRSGHFPSQVSGGESQRAAVARAVVSNPSIILADEPTGNLDRKNSDRFIGILKDLQKREKLTVLVVTHDDSLAQSAQKRFTLIEGAIRPV